MNDREFRRSLDDWLTREDVPPDEWTDSAENEPDIPTEEEEWEWARELAREIGDDEC